MSSSLVHCVGDVYYVRAGSTGESLVQALRNAGWGELAVYPSGRRWSVYGRSAGSGIRDDWDAVYDGRIGYWTLELGIPF